MSSTITLETFVEEDQRREQEKRDFETQIELYTGQLYTDEFLIQNFPLKLKIEERLKQLKTFMFFLASVYNIHDVKKNGGIFFTKDTFMRAGLDISGMQQSNWLKGMKNCGIIYVRNNHYQFGHGKNNFCKIYGLNQLGIIKSFPQEYQAYLEAHKDDIKTPDAVVNIANDIKAEVYEAPIRKNASKKTSKRNPFEKEIKKANEPTIEQRIEEFTEGSVDDFTKKLQEYNVDKNDYTKKTFNFKIKGKNKITGRAYSKYIATRNDEFYETDRTVWCRENGLKYRYDIKSAVPRVSHLLTYGVWKDSSFDFYQEILDRCKDVYVGNRKSVKDLHMRMRFGKSAKKSFSEYCFAHSKNVKKICAKTGYEYWYDVEKPHLEKQWEKIYQICEELEGTDHTSSVFYFESYIELYVVWKLKQMGITAYNIYDEFYYDKECDIEAIIKEAALYVYKKVEDYRNGKKS